MAQAPAKKHNSMRCAQAQIRQRIRNLVDEVHKKTILWLCAQSQRHIQARPAVNVGGSTKNLEERSSSVAMGAI
ncbi:hypothetical protein G9A89_001897 [Geosiphon pyriformis]|nr:hypothetical protein G9A89_001897 [Geosiphon pyriformis]